MRQYILDDQIRRFGRLLNYSGLLATVAGAAFGYSLLHMPVIRQQERTLGKIDELRLSIQNATAIRQQHEKVSERLATAKERIKAVQERVPRDADSGKFFDDVSQIALEEKLFIKDYSPAKPVVKDGYTQVEVTLSGRGSFASICSFFDRVSKLNRLSKLENLTLNANDNETEYPITATLIIYFGLNGKEGSSNKEAKRG